MPQLAGSTIKTITTTAREDAEKTIRKVHTIFGVAAPPMAVTLAPLETGIHDAAKLNYYYFHPDHLGSSSYMTNGNGTATQHMEYLPFGETLVDEHFNSFNSPFKYNGKEFDEETGNYYYGARYYDPKWSIFVSVDPLAEKYRSVSSYTYCLDNPINVVDPDGRDIIYLNDSHAVSGLGHGGVLIGNDIDGWRYVSMNGTGEGSGAWGDSKNADLGDIPAKIGIGGVWRGNDFRGSGLSLEEIIQIVNTSNPEEQHHYNRAIRIKTSPEEDEIAFKAAQQQASSPRYSISIRHV